MTLAVALAGAAAASACRAASFACAKAKSAPEKLICGSPDLSRLDEQGARSYAAALAAGPDKALVRAWQRDWLRTSRDGCTDAQCLRDALSAHAAELDEFAQAAAAGPTVSGLYERYFKGKPDRHSAQIMLVALAGHRVRVRGDAIWVGNAATGNVNTGEVDGIARVGDGGHVRYDDDHCHLALTVGKGSLTVDELADSQCGGMNVTFAGEYRMTGGAR